jgi:hypothetical protein
VTDSRKPTRWYVVEDKTDQACCLVQANNTAQAFRRAGQHYCVARAATAAEAIAMMRAGRDVIPAPDTPEQADFIDEPDDPVAAAAELSNSQVLASSLGQAVQSQDTYLASTANSHVLPTPPSDLHALPPADQRQRKASDVFGTLNEGNTDE